MGSNWMMAMMVMAAFGPTGQALAAKDISAGLSPHDLGASGCHSLIMEQECKAYRSALASLPPGAQRDRILREYHDLIREREASCSIHKRGSVIVYRP